MSRSHVAVLIALALLPVYIGSTPGETHGTTAAVSDLVRNSKAAMLQLEGIQFFDRLQGGGFGSVIRVDEAADVISKVTKLPARNAPHGDLVLGRNQRKAEVLLRRRQPAHERDTRVTFAGQQFYPSQYVMYVMSGIARKLVEHGFRATKPPADAGGSLRAPTALVSLTLQAAIDPASCDKHTTLAYSADSRTASIHAVASAVAAAHDIPYTKFLKHNVQLRRAAAAVQANESVIFEGALTFGGWNCTSETDRFFAATPRMVDNLAVSLYSMLQLFGD